jgi:uncharacterized protein YmfQ (DUF2313 family)
MSVSEKLLALTRQLYPKGRAFKMPADGFIERLHRALSVSEQQVYEDALSILNNILPDNDGFTADDATAWERRLGLITNESVSLADRKLAIIRKINHPGIIKSRQSALYLEGQLRAAGFDVYVFENRFLEEIIGIELTNDADFDSNGAWYGIMGNPILFNTGSVDITTLFDRTLVSPGIIDSGKTYQIEVVLDSISSGSISIFGATPTITIITTVGTHIFTFTSDLLIDDATVSLSATLGSAATISRFSIKEVTEEYVTKTPEELSGNTFITYIEHGEVEHGEVESGGVYNNLIVNHIDEDRELGFELGGNLRGSFFVGGTPVGTYADVDIERKDEFRQLILKLKPVQSVGFLFINYV